MISFVWSSKFPFISGSGGSESYTAGQIRELQSRGIPCRILILNHGINRSRRDFPDITFKKLQSVDELSELDDTIIFITYPLKVKTKRKAYVILHIPPPSHSQHDPLFDLSAMAGKKYIAPSKYSARIWSHYYAKNSRLLPIISVVYPFAEPSFANVNRPKNRRSKTKILFAGRLTPDKGIYTLMAALHLQQMKNIDYSLTVTTAGSNSEDGSVIKNMLKHNKWVKMAPARRSPKEMAKLMAQHDIVVMPTTDIFWKESFGIVSVEAQHAGCRVVASRTGGLPETNCGGMISVKPDDPMALAKGLALAAQLGPLTENERMKAQRQFTQAKSVDSLLKIIKFDQLQLRTQQPLRVESPAGLSYQALALNRVGSKQ